jgi:hypothetical protein
MKRKRIPHKKYYEELYPGVIVTRRLYTKLKKLYGNRIETLTDIHGSGSAFYSTDRWWELYSPNYPSESLESMWGSLRVHKWKLYALYPDNGPPIPAL